MRRAMVLLAMLAVTARAGGEDAPAKKALGLTDAEQEAFLAEGTVVRVRQSIDLTKPVNSLGGGTEIDFRDSFRNNVAAYRLDRLLGLGRTGLRWRYRWDLRSEGA